MNIQDLYLKTAFCCMACDGDIADEEVILIKEYSSKKDYFSNIPLEETINEYIEEINARGMSFLNDYLNDIKNADLSEEEELTVVRIAIEMIEADNIIQYSEIKFFKKIRKLLSISDDAILKEFPDKEDFLLPDIKRDEYTFIQDISFEKIDFSQFDIKKLIDDKQQ